MSGASWPRATWRSGVELSGQPDSFRQADPLTASGRLALPSGQQHAQAGDAAFEFLELADVRHDRGQAHAVEEIGGAGSGRGDQHLVCAQRDDMAAARPVLPPGGPPGTARPAPVAGAARTCRRAARSPRTSGAARCPAGRRSRCGPAGPAARAAGRCPRRWSARRAPRTPVWPACSTSPPSRVPGSGIAAVRRPIGSTIPATPATSARRARAGQHRQVLADHHRIFSEDRGRAVLSGACRIIQPLAASASACAACRARATSTGVRLMWVRMPSASLLPGARTRAVPFTDRSLT